MEKPSMKTDAAVIAVKDARQLVEKALKLRSLDSKSIELLIDDHLGAEINGKQTHGLAKLLLLDDVLANRRGEPTVESRHSSVVLIEGNGSLGVTCVARASEIAVELVDESGMAIMGIKNFARYGRLSVVGRVLAEHGLVSIVMNNAGPPAVPPPGSAVPILGTNPLAITIPTDPVVSIDIATSKSPWGEIRQAMVEGRDLPEQTFMDVNGQVTRLPENAHSVLPFGGEKGFALCVAIELLCGAIVPAQTGLRAQSQFDLGSLIICFRMDAFNDRKSVQEQLNNLMSDLETAPKMDGTPSRVPGTKEVLLKDIDPDHEISVSRTVLDGLKAMSQGEQSPMEINKLND